MALGRETIGTAYVRILADGSGLDESVKRQMKDHGPIMHAAGREGADEYVSGWEEEFKKTPARKTMRDGIANALAKNDAIDKFLKSPKWEEQKRRLRTQFGEAGEVAGADMVKGLISTGDFEAFTQRVKNILPEISKATKKITDEEDRVARDFRANLAKIDRDITRTLHDSGNELTRFHHTVTGVYDDINHTLSRTGQDWVKFHEDLKKSRDKDTDSIRSWSEQVDHTADVIGRAFGKGSRNNFLNFFGSVISNIVSLANVFGTLKDAATKAFNVLAKNAEEAGGWMQGLLLTVGDLAPKLAAGGLAIGGFVFALGTLVSVVSLAAGWITALASSIAFGLVGALAPLVGLLGPIAFAAGAVATAFIGMDTAGKKLTKETLKPLTDLLKDLGDAVRPGILKGLTDAFDEVGKKKGLLEDITGLAKTAGTAVGDFIREFSAAALGKGTRDFLRMMNETLPETMTRLGRIFGNLVDAIGSVFTVLNRPGGPVDDFLTWLDTITSRFDTWASSAEGRNSIADFFDKAQASAKVLGDFLGSVWDLLSNLIAAGRAPGDQMFGGITETLQGWADWIKANPDVMKSWFDSAREFGSAVGGAALAIGDLFDALDTGASRQAAITFFRLLGGAIQLVSNFVNLFDDDVTSLMLTIAGMAALWPVVNRFTTSVGGAFTILSGKSDTATSKMSALQGAARNLAGPVGMGLLIDSTHRSNDMLHTLESMAGGAALGFAVGGPLGAGIGAAAGALLALFTNGKLAKTGLEAAKEGSDDAVSSLGTLSDVLDQVTGAYTELARQQVYQSAKNAGLIDQYAQLGVSGDTVVDSLLGQPAAMRQTADAIDSVQSSIRGMRDSADEWDKKAREFYRGQLDGTGITASDAAQWHQRAEALRENASVQEEQLGRMGKMRKGVQDEVQQVKDASAATHDWDKVLKGVPTEVVTEFLAGNIPSTDRQVTKLLEKYGVMDKKVIETTVKAVDADITDKKLAGIIKKIQDYGKEHPQPTVGLNTAAYDKAFNDIVANNKSLDAANPSVTLLLNDAQYNQQITFAEQQRKMLDGSTATVTIITERRGGGGKVVTGPQAAGSIVASATRLLVGEAGPEAIVPLHRPLHMVDPAVRELSAIAQGLNIPKMASGGVVTPAKVIDVGGIQIITPTTDPAAVAQETINRLVAVGY